MLVDLLVRVDYVLELDIICGSALAWGAEHLNRLITLINLAYAIDGAHD